MKKKLILPLLILISVVGCTGNSGTTNSEETSKGGNQSVILDVPEADKIRPVQGDFGFNDLNDPDAIYDESKWYKNDLKHVPLPDPYVIEEDGVYYIYGTTDRTAAVTVDCYSTTDFNTFTLHANVYERDGGGWSGKTGIFAPEVVKIDDVFYMYYSSEDKNTGRRYIDVLVSDSPTGKFTEYVGEDFYGNQLNGYESPIFRHNDTINLSVLDQTLFIDDDGSMYMYYSVYDTGVSQYIVGFEMVDPVTPDWDTYKVLIRPGEPTSAPTFFDFFWWETYQDFEVAEGPQMIKSPNGKYYLTYSVNHYPDRYYTVCYAVSDTPLGDYEKPYEKTGQWTNLLFGYAGGMDGSTVYKQWEGYMSGTAHHCFFKIGDQYMIGYHAHKNRKNSDEGRMFGMDKLFFDEDGVPYCIGPSSTIQNLPEAISGFKNIALDARVYASSTIQHAERINDNYSTSHYNLPQEQDKEVICPEGVCYIELEFDKEYEIGGIQIVNSTTFGSHFEEIEYINFFNDNALLDLVTNYEEVDYDKEFVYPTSGITIDITGVRANKVVICMDNDYQLNINEIIVLGK